MLEAPLPGALLRWLTRLPQGLGGPNGSVGFASSRGLMHEDTPGGRPVSVGCQPPSEAGCRQMNRVQAVRHAWAPSNPHDPRPRREWLPELTVEDRGTQVVNQRRRRHRSGQGMARLWHPVGDVQQPVTIVVRREHA